ncbi:XamI family restriction endonuclease [Microbacterium resistens]
MASLRLRRERLRTSLTSRSPGESCSESSFAGRKADVIVRFWHGRVLAIECKVSNSEVNSVRRVKSDAAKSEVRIIQFGQVNMGRAAVLPASSRPATWRAPRHAV